MICNVFQMKERMLKAQMGLVLQDTHYFWVM